MTTFWLVVAISIAGGPFRAMEDTKFPDFKSCQAAAHERGDHIEGYRLADKDGKDIDEEYEIGVSCQIHHSKSDPA
jgi:hypothetical protein